MFFDNKNGKRYWKIFGEAGKPGLLISLTDETDYGPKYIVAGVMESASWYGGQYFADFDEAYNEYKRMTE